MLPPKLRLPPQQQRLLNLFRELPEQEQESLLSYAEFLQQRGRAEVPARSVVPEPAEIPRPQNESVVAAIRRLSSTFYMLDKDELLHEASALMTAHVMQGRPAVEVIDELEVIFRRRYERVKSTAD
ncbi:MAG: DUF2281 domain-containing protein [Chromatiaceae bacterium]|jgi:hypothetical protein|nr:DUF2281 domain-containing protein [Chromatiaceae bacterium]